jgi:hypothetical protein
MFTLVTEALAARNVDHQPLQQNPADVIPEAELGGKIDKACGYDLLGVSDNF